MRLTQADRYAVESDRTAVGLGNNPLLRHDRVHHFRRYPLSSILYPLSTRSRTPHLVHISRRRELHLEHARSQHLTLAVGSQ